MSDTAARVVLPSGRAQVHLTGFMGSGKSTVGRLLARRLLWNFLDLDGLIERHEGRTVAQIFAEDGEAGFRASEHHVLRQAVNKPATVVALGGGTLIDPRNRELSRCNAVLVWLRCPVEALEARCAGLAADRPLWGDHATLRQRYAERLPGYEAADIAVDATEAPDAVAATVHRALVEAAEARHPGA
jgi:shikimate kinase